MIFVNEYFQGVRETNKLGFPTTNPQYIPEEYLTTKFFVVFRTCLSFGDWVTVSAMPRLLKAKYPDSTVVIPSPVLLKRMYPTGCWSDKHANFHIQVTEVFSYNPHVDGMIDELPIGQGIYHDHFRIYDLENPNIPLVEQMLKFWRFDPATIIDSMPELYWTDEEKAEGDSLIKQTFGDKPFGFLYIDDFAFERIDESKIDDTTEPLVVKRSLIQKKINEFDKLQWLYYAGKDITESAYKTTTRSVDVRSLKTTLRIQSYIKTKSKMLIGQQGGYGTDAMGRYTQCYVVPLGHAQINEHMVRTITYLVPE